MKRFFLIFFLLSFFAGHLTATNIDDLKRIAQKSNLAKDWIAVAEYYFLKNNDIFLAKQAAQNAFNSATKERNNSMLAESLMYLVELDYANISQEEYQQRYQTILQYARIGDDTNILAGVICNMAVFQRNVGNYDESIKLFKEGIAIGVKPNQLPALYDHISISFNAKGEGDSALFYTEKALELAIPLKDTAIICECNTQYAIIYRQKKQYDKALEYYQKNLDLCKQMKNFDMYAITCYNIAMVYSECNKPDEYIEFARLAVETAENFILRPEYRSMFLITLGNALRGNNQISQAIDTLKRALILSDGFLPQSLRALSILATCYLDKRQIDSCELYLNRIKDLVEKNKNLSPEGYYIIKGRLLVIQEKYNEAMPYFMAYEELLRSLGKSILQGTPALYNDISVAYEKGPHDYKNALYYKQIAYALQDSIYKKENSEMVNEFAIRYQSAEKELEISRLNEQQQQMIFQRWLFIGGAVILSLLLLTAFIYNRFLRLRKEKEAALLTQQMEEKEIEYQKLLVESERQRVQSYVEGLEAERQRIATEIHDYAANEVFLIRLELEKSAPLEESTAARLNVLHARLRDISHELNYPVFQHISLPEILEHITCRLNEKTGIHVILDLKSRDTLTFLPETLSGELYRILQEAVGNALKYSNATELKLILEAANHQVVVMIEDNGRGFDTTKPHTGMGLKIMNERCKALHGNLQLHSEVGKGTRVRIEIPLNTEIS